MAWTGEGLSGDLPGAIAYFESKLPGWWFSVGYCHVSADASCSPDSAGQDFDLLDHRFFDEGFDIDLPPPATMADALVAVTDMAVRCRDAFRSTGTISAAVQALEYGAAQ